MLFLSVVLLRISLVLYVLFSFFCSDLVCRVLPKSPLLVLPVPVRIFVDSIILLLLSSLLDLFFLSTLNMLGLGFPFPLSVLTIPRSLTSWLCSVSFCAIFLLSLLLVVLTTSLLLFVPFSYFLNISFLLFSSKVSIQLLYSFSVSILFFYFKKNLIKLYII